MILFYFILFNQKENKFMVNYPLHFLRNLLYCYLIIYDKKEYLINLKMFDGKKQKLNKNKTKMAQ